MEQRLRTKLENHNKSHALGIPAGSVSFSCKDSRSGQGIHRQHLCQDRSHAFHHLQRAIEVQAPQPASLLLVDSY